MFYLYVRPLDGSSPSLYPLLGEHPTFRNPVSWLVVEIPDPALNALQVTDHAHALSAGLGKVITTCLRFADQEPPTYPITHLLFPRERPTTGTQIEGIFLIQMPTNEVLFRAPASRVLPSRVTNSTIANTFSLSQRVVSVSGVTGVLGDLVFWATPCDTRIVVTMGSWPRPNYTREIGRYCWETREWFPYGND
ncbi:MAG: hypothetical protein KKA90_00645 [Nanoarchaeota archaeon]|nr:hypothetical protein [Nanoarchaeota archaeon]